MIGDWHAWFGWWAAWICGASGLFALTYQLLRRPIDIAFKWVVGTGVMVMLAQITVGFIAYGLDGTPGTIHMFYGFVILITLCFIYIYRVQFRRRPALYWGLALLFMMGLGMRGIVSFGQNF